MQPFTVGQVPLTAPHKRPVERPAGVALAARNRVTATTTPEPARGRPGTRGDRDGGCSRSSDRVRRHPHGRAIQRLARPYRHTARAHRLALTESGARRAPALHRTGRSRCLPGRMRSHAPLLGCPLPSPGTSRPSRFRGGPVARRAGTAPLRRRRHRGGVAHEGPGGHRARPPGVHHRCRHSHRRPDLDHPGVRQHRRRRGTDDRWPSLALRTRERPLKPPRPGHRRLSQECPTPS